MVGGIRARAEARPVGPALRLLLGRRYSRAGPARGRRTIPAGHYRRDAGRQEGAGRPARRGAGEPAVLARTAARPEAPPAQDRPPTRPPPHPPPPLAPH